MIPPVASLEAPLQGDLHLKGYHQEGYTAPNYGTQTSHMMPPVASLEAPLQGGLQLKGYHPEG